METQHICSECGKTLGPDTPQGLCPACLLKAGLGSGVSVAPSGQSASASARFIAPSPEELQQAFPQLDILELIGQGGMGAVYKARQTALDRVVALKILPPGIGADGAFTERFTREAKALAKLNHPGIVTLYEFGQADGLFFFLMEFVDGVTLRHLMGAERLSPRDALAIVPQICDALQYAHDQGIVHRDIKPENILLDRLGRVKVADFGLAKLIETREEFDGEGARRASTGQTERSRVMGTPQYMAPEQSEAPTSVDHRADIYSLGVVLYQMLTGELPGKPFEPPSRKVHVDVRLDEIVLKALEREPERRYQQVGMISTEIETISRPVPLLHVDSETPGFTAGGVGVFFVQSATMREIYAHMTPAEKCGARMRGGLYGLAAAAIWLLPVLALQYLSAPAVLFPVPFLLFVFAVVPLLQRRHSKFLVFPVLQRKHYEFLCKTAWARQHGISVEQLAQAAPLAEVPRRRITVAVFWLGMIAAVVLTLIPLLRAFSNLPEGNLLHEAGLRVGLGLLVLVILGALAASALQAPAVREVPGTSPDGARAADTPSRGKRPPITRRRHSVLFVATAIVFMLLLAAHHFSDLASQAYSSLTGSRRTPESPLPPQPVAQVPSDAFPETPSAQELPKAL